MSDCSNGRYKFNYQYDGAGNLTITEIFELLDASGTVLGTPITHIAGSAGFTAALAAAQTCDGPATDWEILCDPNTGEQVAVQFQIAFDGTLVPLTGILLDGTTYAGDLSLLEQCPATGNEVNVTEEVFCDNGVTKSRVTITVTDPDGNVIGTPSVTWIDVLGTATTAPADVTLVSTGACPVTTSNFCVSYC